MAIANRVILSSPCSRHLYFFAALLIDALLGQEVNTQAWVFAGVLVLLLGYMTARRFTDIGWSQLWVIPYALLTLSPYVALLFAQHADARLITLGVLVLQVPAMIWPKKKAPVSMAAAQ
jgi:uncharacterized membrane protein YhaH (DUF805 family)